jgi:hypothetical protein
LCPAISTPYPFTYKLADSHIPSSQMSRSHARIRDLLGDMRINRFLSHISVSALKLVESEGHYKA